MPASKTQLIGGQFQDNEGNVLALGYLKLRLSADELVTGVGQIASGIVTTVTLDSGGSVDTSTPQLVWGNDQMSPVNSFYIVEGYKANGQLAWGPNNEQVIGSGGTFDVGTWVPNVVISWTYPAAVGPTGATGATGPAGSAVLSAANSRYWKAFPNSAATSPNIGFSQASIVAGTGSTGLVIATATEPNYTSYLSGASSGNQYTASWTGTNTSALNPNVFQIWSTQTLTLIRWRAQLQQLTNCRMWLAVNNASTSAAPVYTALKADDPNSFNMLGFRYSSVADAAGTFKAYAANGATSTVTDTGVTADTAGHDFQIVIVSTASVDFYIDGVKCCNISTNLPSSSTRIGDIVSIDNVSTANAAQVNLNLVLATEL